ncbi:glycosyltransferase family 2 protein [Acetobacter thailandicus]|uniref:glycosyltransferase family 2 protein n=1 Tax=Acetobacter thailandicus TaxID=1502842 RepID=UPI001BAA74FA|nr:glycosyltransferase family 2 protein [Acetobacter thailandicus]MBS0959271.1 glycosyltransferase family 2 protein [Acetobacter thailandicus]
MGFRSAAITMVYNESKILPVWLDYYGSNLGYDNLYIIDHGSDDGSTTRIPGNVIKIPRDDFDDVQRAAFITHLHTALLKSFDCVIYTDCDEFLLPRPDRYNSLASYLKLQPHGNNIRAVGIDVMPGNLSLPPVDFSRDILPQRPYGFLTPWESKPLVAKIPTQWEPGFHECNQHSLLDEDLWLFHLKLCDIDYAMKRLHVTRSMKWNLSHNPDSGAHQRRSDQEMRDFFDAVVRGQEPGYLSDLPLTELLSRGSTSKLRRIPDMFLQYL